ncbi:MAG: hypothetical protein GTO63_08205 [Anaerolineae bacterium]|nr:hypothetical protein [Anaerolineae bacterium]NIN94899.1 hypothetical protein [Anaerolineae bacterium]
MVDGRLDEIEDLLAPTAQEDFWRDGEGARMLTEEIEAPDFTLPQVDGPPITLSETLGKGHHVYLIFLRYLG